MLHVLITNCFSFSFLPPLKLGATIDTGLVILACYMSNPYSIIEVAGHQWAQKYNQLCFPFLKTPGFEDFAQNGDVSQTDTLSLLYS